MSNSFNMLSFYHPTPFNLAILAVIIFIVYHILSQIALTTYNLLFHPLRSVPGPPLAKVTSRWLGYHDSNGNRTLTIHAAHDKYGPIVRVAPNELSFASVSAIKEIYGQATPFLKTAFYSGFEQDSIRTLFTSRDKVFHAQRRKLLSHAFSQKAVLAAEPLLVEQIRKFNGWLEKKQGEDMNVFMWFRNLTLDLTSTLFMGEEIGGLDGDEAHEYLHNIDDYFKIAGLRLQFPWLLKLMAWIPHQRWQYFLRAQDRLYEYGVSSFQRYLEKYGRDSKRDDLLKKVLHGDSTLPKLSDREVRTEMASILVAGMDTTSIVLTYTCWHLATNPELQVNVRNELRDAGVTFPNGVAVYKDIERLEYLDAFVMEALRVYTAGCSSLPRAVPPQGAVVCGLKVPGGTTISTQAYTQHNNATVFPSPEKVVPERWLSPPKGTAEMREAYIPFSRGTRVCPGIFLATMELKLILTSIINQYQIGVGKCTTSDTMSRMDHFVLYPKGGFCDLVFTKV